MPGRVPRSLQSRILYTALLSIAASTSSSAQYSDTLDCSNTVPIDGAAYDLSSLTSEHTVKRTRETPPTTMWDELRFNLCQELVRKDGATDGDQVREVTCKREETY
jgi:hypothetical protein